jgi:hypothetical protein
MSLGSSAISVCGSLAAAFSFLGIVAQTLLLALSFEVTCSSPVPMQSDATRAAQQM